MAMDSNDIANVLNTFARWPRSFSIEEILNFLEESTVDKEKLHHMLLSDSRFICLSELPEECCYIPRTTLLLWFSNLNVRLAQIRKFRLDEHQLVLTISCLRRDGRWRILPKQAVQLGQSLGLISPAWTSGYYVFPLAWILSFYLLQYARSALEGLVRNLELGFSLKQVQQKALEVMRKQCLEALSRCSDRQLEIVSLREGLKTGTPMTLREVARVFNVTAERIRQLEIQFWNEFGECCSIPPLSPRVRRWFWDWLRNASDFQTSYPSAFTLRQKLLDTSKEASVWNEFLECYSILPPPPLVRRMIFAQALLTAMLCEVMDKSGSLVIDADSPDARLREFLAECSHIPCVNLSNIGLEVLASSASDLSALESSLDFPDMVDPLAIAARFESSSPVPFPATDVRKLADSLARFRRRHLGLTQRVYIALRSIGRPAHYSQIKEVHNSLFPDCSASEHNIHTALSREQHGVVWIGIRGTFALKEWGYERPSKSLFEAVTEIVEKKFKETGKPVSFTVIAAEISKYRMIVKPASLAFAAHCNPNLRRVSKDCFIPKGLNDQIQEEISLNELDKILQEFREKYDECR